MSRNKPSTNAAGRRGHFGRAAAGQPPAPHRRILSSEKLFGREPFTAEPMPRYYGTGVAGYTSGPGFTGGYYGFGEEAPETPTELELEYLHDLYGTEWESAAPPAAPPSELLRRAAPPRRYPPGPKGYQRSDARIREDLCDRLMRARHIDSSEVTVEVANGKVILDGTVPQRGMKHAIEDMADACLGVQDIDNRIRVLAPNPGG